MSATLMVAMRAANTKLASNLESKLNKTREESNKQTATLEKRITYVLEVELNKISDNLEAKLFPVSESPGNRLNSVSNSLNKTLHSMIANVASK